MRKHTELTTCVGLALAILVPIALFGVVSLVRATPSAELMLSCRLGLLVALSVLVTGTLKYGNARLLLSPFLLLAGWVAAFFVLLPAALLGLTTDDSASIASYLSPLHLEMARAYHGGIAETLVVALCAALLIAYAAFLGLAPVSDAVPRPADDRPTDCKCLLTVVVALAAMAVALQAVAVSTGWFAGTGFGLVRQVGEGANPMAALALTLALHAYAKRGRAAIRWVAAAMVIAAGAAAALLTVKVMFVALMAALLMAFALAPGRRRAILIFMATGMVAGCVMVVGITNIRSVRPPDASLSETVSAVRVHLERETNVRLLLKPLVSKFWIRQAWTAGCLQAVAVRHLDERHPDASPLYFLRGLVPRYFFPDKPNLSLGTYYAIEYCGMSGADDINPNAPHSASITLLGEPLIRAGWLGLAVALAFVMAVFGITTAVQLGGGDRAVVVTVALLPWLSDFDQSLALYTAVAAKTALYIGGAFIVSLLACRGVAWLLPGASPGR